MRGVIAPLASTRYSSFQLISELHHALQAIPGLKRSVLSLSSALDKAEEFRKNETSCINPSIKQTKRRRIKLMLFCWDALILFSPLR